MTYKALWAIQDLSIVDGWKMNTAQCGFSQYVEAEFVSDVTRLDKKYWLTKFFPVYPTRNPDNRKVWFLNKEKKFRRMSFEKAMEHIDEIAWVPATFAHKVLDEVDFELDRFYHFCDLAEMKLVKDGYAAYGYPELIRSLVSVEEAQFFRSAGKVYCKAVTDMTVIVISKPGAVRLRLAKVGSAHEQALKAQQYKSVLSEDLATVGTYWPYIQRVA